ncbi:hypothetical protein LXL04_027981 [Taraxacum kok-saghyz]
MMVAMLVIGGSIGAKSKVGDGSAILKSKVGDRDAVESRLRSEVGHEEVIAEIAPENCGCFLKLVPPSRFPVLQNKRNPPASSHCLQPLTLGLPLPRKADEPSRDNQRPPPAPSPSSTLTFSAPIVSSRLQQENPSPPILHSYLRFITASSQIGSISRPSFDRSG